MWHRRRPGPMLPSTRSPTSALSLFVAMLTEAAAGVGEEQVDAAGVRDEVVIHGARALLLGLAHHPFKVGEEAVDGAAKVRVAAVSLGHLIEARSPFGRVD